MIVPAIVKWLRGDAMYVPHADALLLRESFHQSRTMRKKTNGWYPTTGGDVILTNHYTCPGVELHVVVDEVMQNGRQCRVTAYDECPNCHLRFGALLVANDLLKPIPTE
jgi:hypothetical protein